jgi:hypothetical protein
MLFTDILRRKAQYRSKMMLTKPKWWWQPHDTIGRYIHTMWWVLILISLLVAYICKNDVFHISYSPLCCEFWGSCKSSSTHAEYVVLQQYFSLPRLVIYFFPTSPIKLKLGLQKVGDY